MKTNITYRERKKGNWQYIISYKDEMGKWKQKGKQGFLKKSVAKEAAEEALKLLKDEIELTKGLDKDYKEIMLKEFSEIFIEKLSIHRELGTVNNYRKSLSHLKNLNNYRITDIENKQIQECVDKMIDKGLNISTIKNYYNNIRHIFDSAITQYRIININPTVGVNIPKYKKTVGKKVLSLEEYNALLLDFTSSRFYIVLLLAGSCGLRLGEIAGVTRDNIDKKNKTLKIEKQWKKLKDGTMGFSYLKTNNSNRMIPLSDELIKKLDLYMIENKVDSTNRLIVRSICNYSSELNKELKKYNTTIHKLRHTYATTLISNGIDFKTAAKILGHDVIQTMKTYSHVNDRMMENAANKINDIFK